MISFKEKDQMGCHEVSLKHINESGENCDYRVEQAGWAYADCVIGTGEILRCEDSIFKIVYQDLIDFRRNVLKKTTDHPINIILTSKIN